MNSLHPATAEEFSGLAQSPANGSRRAVAVVKSVSADLITPVTAFLRLARASSHAFLLESVEGGEHLARYSFMGVDPEAVIRTRDGVTTVTSADGSVQSLEGVTAIDYLREHLKRRKVATSSYAAPLAGGAVGYLGFGAARWFDAAMHAEQGDADDACFMLFNTVLAFDHARQQLLVQTLAFLDGNESPKALYSAAVGRIEAVLSTLRIPSDVELKNAFLDTPAVNNPEFESNFTQDEFEKAVLEAKELIAAGECYQTVLSQRFTRKTVADPVSIYRALRRSNPSPYMFLLRCGGESLIGASPEMLVRCTGKRLEYRPIAGTRPRGTDEEHDEQLAVDLLADEKERAEHMMLVDLGRNDLGRVSKFGSVRPERLMKVEKYSHVQHLVTELTSELRDDYDRFDALGACFPAGTVTGAPKIRAMQAIADIERTARSVYSGAVVYADYAENLDSCIAIRTVELRDGVARVQAGAGVVADSVPEREYEETLNKSRALRLAVAAAESGM